jgi:hypothetical protein
MSEALKTGDTWALGFDCAHAWDISPGMPAGFIDHDATYRDIEYVRGECRCLAEQVAALAGAESM